MVTWDELFRQEAHRLQEPHPAVADFALALCDAGAESVLDLGCGAGRHTILLARQGFRVCSMDVSEYGLESTRRWLAAEKLSAWLQLADMTSLPYPDSTFDAVLSLHVIYHNVLERIERTAAEIHRVLRPGGHVLLSLISTRSYRTRHLPAGPGT
jgi:SAM-dependent methyltransferase